MKYCAVVLSVPSGVTLASCAQAKSNNHTTLCVVFRDHSLQLLATASIVQLSACKYGAALTTSTSHLFSAQPLTVPHLIVPLLVKLMAFAAGTGVKQSTAINPRQR